MRDGTVGTQINRQATTHYAYDWHVVKPVHGIATFGLGRAPPVVQTVEGVVVFDQSASDVGGIQNGSG
jgi:hypothetical protein